MHNCYTTDWQRTEPDYVIYLPTMPGGRDEYAVHIHVFYTPGGDLMCIWTQGTFESAADCRVVFSRSTDGGHTWSPMQVMADPLGPLLCPGLGSVVVACTASTVNTKDLQTKACGADLCTFSIPTMMGTRGSTVVSKYLGAEPVLITQIPRSLQSALSGNRRFEIRKIA